MLVAHLLLIVLTLIVGAGMIGYHLAHRLVSQPSYGL